jgi:hypothetical protein
MGPAWEAPLAGGIRALVCSSIYSARELTGCWHGLPCPATRQWASARGLPRGAQETRRQLAQEFFENPLDSRTRVRDVSAARQCWPQRLVAVWSFVRVATDPGASPSRREWRYKQAYSCRPCRNTLGGGWQCCNRSQIASC